MHDLATRLINEIASARASIVASYLRLWPEPSDDPWGASDTFDSDRAESESHLRHEADSDASAG